MNRLHRMGAKGGRGGGAGVNWHVENVLFLDGNQKCMIALCRSEPLEVEMSKLQSKKKKSP